MLSSEDIWFAQKYPFLKIARAIVRETDFSLDDIPDNVIERARLIVMSALQGKNYSVTQVSSKSILRDEVLAFPLSKIFVSVINTEDSFLKFSALFGKNIFSNLENDAKENNNALFLVAKELGVGFFVSDEKNADAFASLALSDFLSIDSADFRLVNRPVSFGRVFLSKNEFIRFLSFKAQKIIFDSLPVDVKGIPKSLVAIAKELSALSFEAKKSSFKGHEVLGVKPEFFPPCIEKLYLDILSGRNLAHLERFSLATFMLSIGMAAEEVINLYSFAPNFDRKITAYQVMRLAGKGGTKYSAAGCSKLAEYKVRLPNCPCVANKKIKHPVFVYKSNLGQSKS